MTIFIQLLKAYARLLPATTNKGQYDMRNIDALNALVNPIMYGEHVEIGGADYKVCQNMDGHWFLDTMERPIACVAGSMVDFIARIVQFRDEMEA